MPRSSTKLVAEDVLLVEGEREDILRARDMDAIDIVLVLLLWPV